MSTDTILSILNNVGIFAFAISGFLAAADKKLDLFGALVIGLVTALGGGTLRDLLLNTEIGWISNVNYIYIGLGGGIAAWLFRSFISRLRKTLFIFDTIGIG
ncbi:MAG: TRIC cation channel family protein, partial [Flavobacteriales bacterium]|nr:TRIC cation channel family protein [Flavobacteriales bacterium]